MNSKTLMMQLNNRKTWITLGIVLVVFWIHASILSLQINVNTIEKIENDPTAVAAMSLAEDKDLNIINNIPNAWAATEMLNHPAYLAEGSAAIRYPFQLYGVLLSKLGFRSDNCFVENYMTAHVFSNMIFLILLVILLYKFLIEFGFTKQVYFVIAASILGTPLIWKVVFEPTGVMLPLSLALTAATYFLWTIKEEHKFWQWALVGALYCFLYTIKKSMLFYVLTPILMCVLLKNYKNIIPLLLGWSGIYGIYLINKYFQYGDFALVPLRFTTYVEESNALAKTLIGPNGAFFLSPILIFAIVALVKCVVDAIERNEKWNVKEKFICSLILSLTMVTFLNPLLLFDKLTIGSGQFFGQIAVITIGLALFFSYTDIKNTFLIKLLFVSCVLWNIGALTAYFYNRAHFGLTYRIEFMPESVAINILSILPNTVLIFLESIVLWLPLSILIWYLIKLIVKKNYSIVKIFSMYSIALVFLITGINVTYNRSNTLQLRSNGYYKNKTRGSGIPFYYFDQINSALDRALLIEKFNGSINVTEALLSQKKIIQKAAADGIVYDPIGFKKRTEAGEIFYSQSQQAGRSIGREGCIPKNL